MKVVTIVTVNRQILIFARKNSFFGLDVGFGGPTGFSKTAPSCGSGPIFRTKNSFLYPQNFYKNKQIEFLLRETQRFTPKNCCKRIALISLYLYAIIGLFCAFFRHDFHFFVNLVFISSFEHQFGLVLPFLL